MLLLNLIGVSRVVIIMNVVALWRSIFHNLVYVCGFVCLGEILLVLGVVVDGSSGLAKDRRRTHAYYITPWDPSKTSTQSHTDTCSLRRSLVAQTQAVEFMLLIA